MPPFILGFGDQVQGHRGFAGGFRTKDLYDAAAGYAADPQGKIQLQTAGGNHVHLHFGLLAKLPYDLAELLVQRGQSPVKGLGFLLQEAGSGFCFFEAIFIRPFVYGFRESGGTKRLSWRRKKRMPKRKYCAADSRVMQHIKRVRVRFSPRRKPQHGADHAEVLEVGLDLSQPPAGITVPCSGRPGAVRPLLCQFPYDHHTSPHQGDPR